MKLYAEVIINSEALEIDRPFTYKVPEEFNNEIKIGQIVKVPFGKGNKTSEGFILNLKNDDNIKFKTKNIAAILVKDPVIDEDDINLIEFLREKTLCKYIDAFRLLIPVGIMKGAKAKKKKVIVLKNEDLSNIKNPDGYKKIVEFFKTNSGKYTKSELINEHSISQYKLNKLIENEVLSIEEESVFRYNDRVYNKDSAKTLTIEQENIIREYINSDDKMFLLKGVTGSGKTEVYMKLVERVLLEGEISYYISSRNCFNTTND